MINRIWVEVLRHPDGAATYGFRGQLYRAKLGDADGLVLCERTITPTLDSCRALLACGIAGHFVTWHEGDGFARLTGDIAKSSKLELKEGSVRFAHFAALATAEQNTCRRSRPDAPSLRDSMGQALCGTGS